MNKIPDEIKARIEAAEKELAAAKAALKEAEKPLMWTDLPSKSYFKCGHFVFLKLYECHTGRSCAIAIGGGPHGLEPGVWTEDSPYPEFHKPVIRVNIDGTPYEGDPRK